MMPRALRKQKRVPRIRSLPKGGREIRRLGCDTRRLVVATWKSRRPPGSLSSADLDGFYLGRRQGLPHFLSSSERLGTVRGLLSLALEIFAVIKRPESCASTPVIRTGSSELRNSRFSLSLLSSDRTTEGCLMRFWSREVRMAFCELRF